MPALGALLVFLVFWYRGQAHGRVEFYENFFWSLMETGLVLTVCALLFMIVMWRVFR
jgi:hypothetical protein